MVFDGLPWYSKNRPIPEEATSARLQQSRPCAEVARSCGTVFKSTDSYLEVCNGLHREKGWGVIAFITAGIGSLCMAAIFAWLATHVSPIARERGQASLAHWGFGLLALVTLGVFSLSVRSLLADCFNYTRMPIRFNRSDRTIYAFRHNGPGGVISVPWDSAFFYVERKPKAGITQTAPRVVRCLVLDDKGLVVDAFSVGKRVVLAVDEERPAGQQVMQELYQDFEYYRRFMEEGPSSVPPVAEYLTTDISFRTALKMQFEDVPDVINSRTPALWLLLAITALPSLIQATMYYLAQLTCREPVWPEDVERACNSSPSPATGLAS